MRISRPRIALIVILGGALAHEVGCSAGATDEVGGESPASTSGSANGGAGGANNNSSSDMSSSSMGGGFTTGGGEGGQGGTIVNPCGGECPPPGTPDECDGALQGVDDNCNGQVDEGCPCQPGQNDSCFKGDPSYLNNPMYPACAAGTMSCNENGEWVCTGGNHADSIDACYAQSTQACHSIKSFPFQNVDLMTGTGTFSQDAISSSFTVSCPMGVNPCPGVNGNNFQPIVSGEYTVEYTKTIMGGSMEQCSFPLYVGANGLRVELSWNWGSGTKDIDLHLHEPGTTTPWEDDGTGATQDCGWGNCKVGDFVPTVSPTSPTWFDPNNMVPDPVNWFESPVLEENLCYYAPQGAGTTWQNAMLGCHSPRLDIDNVSCTLPNCFPENINVDYPPAGQWMRIGAFMYSSTPTAGITPNVKIFCNGQLKAELGTAGFHEPDAPIVWDSTQGRKWWLPADVRFTEGDECTPVDCVVRPLYDNDNADGLKNPLYYTEAELETSFGLPYAAIPNP